MTESTPTPTAPATPAAPVTDAAPVAPIPNDGGRTPYADPTGNTAAANVDGERRDADRDGKAGKEAAKYRAQLRDVETERDTLRDRLAGFQRQSIDTLSAAAGIKPAALWASGVELASLVADDGTVNGEAVTAAIATAKDTLGLSPTASAADAGIMGGSKAPSAPEPTWAGITKVHAA